MVLSQYTVQNENIKDFFLCLSSTFITTNRTNARIDFLNTSLKDGNKSLKLSKELEKIVNCPVGICEDLHRCEIKIPFDFKGELRQIPITELYFIPEKLDEFFNSSMQSHMQNLSGYEKIRTVGKGAFGTAVLYRKKYDDSFVIVKEINMHDLTASERQLAINELVKTSTETYKMMKTAFGDEAMSRAWVFEWFFRFKEGHQSVNCDSRSGCPSTFRNEDKIAQVRAVVRSDCHLTVLESVQECHISVGSCDEILRKDFNMRRVSAKFVLRLLTEDQQFQRLTTSSDLFQSASDDKEFIKLIITGDELWVYGYDSETKQ
ncbi:protein GVQW3 [Trichonephila clavipes]|nr:protein GVQW3 [Trichonephila clavipes]